MKILLLGSGGREHALAWKMAQSPLTTQLFIAPGNTGTAQCGTNVPMEATDLDAVKRFCITNQIELVVIGPEDPLVKGLVDHLKKEPQLQNLMVIGPSKEAAQLEGSKAYAKAFMQRHDIPTAAYKEFTADTFDEGVAYLQQHSLPIVLKADGLAGGKGVIIAQSHEDAIDEFKMMIQQSKFGDAGKKVVVEEFLNGIELSVFVVTDGKNYVLLPEAKDYKRIGEGDTGLNTGGMGAISPVPFADETFMQKVKTKIIDPTIQGLQKDNLDYKGFIFFGLIKVQNEPFVIEYNCRMGDPETEVVMPRLQSDLVALLVATATQQLNNTTIQYTNDSACTIVAVSGGYPADFKKGYEINGLQSKSGSIVFHAGTKEVNGKITTNGGRVICVTSLAPRLQDAVAISKERLQDIHFTGMYYRADIGYEFQ